jgi:hypothetical protein
MEHALKAILLSTAYLPPISWVMFAIKANEVYIESHDTYPKQTYRNRCRVVTANGLIPLSIPVKKISGHNTKTCDVEIFYEEPWQRLHWRTIDAAYSNSPFYLYYKDELIPFYEHKHRFLLDFNIALCEVIFKMLGAHADFRLTSEYEHSPQDKDDMRNAFSPKTVTKATNLQSYPQVFEDRHGFVPDLSIIDLLFNEGPAALSALNIE